MVDVIKSTSVPTLDENSEELQKKLEEMQEGGTETEESITEEIPKEEKPQAIIKNHLPEVIIF